jgi:hypothetical protein
MSEEIGHVNCEHGLELRHCPLCDGHFVIETQEEGFARANYEACTKHFRDMPDFSDLDEDTRSHWVLGTRAVMEAIERNRAVSSEFDV